MNPSLPRNSWAAARRRDLAILAAFALPWLAVPAMLPRSPARTGLLVTGIIALAGLAWLRWQRRDEHWLVRTLNQRRADMEDSADLLLDGATRTPIQELQRQRLQRRLAAQPADVRDAWPARALGASFLLALLAAAAALHWARPGTLTALQEEARIAPGPVRLMAYTLSITPPAYTGLPVRQGQGLSTQAPQGSLLHWRLRFSPQPAQVALVLLDGRRITLQREGHEWSAQLRLDTSVLYRIQSDGAGAEAGGLHRLDAVADLPPQIRVVVPERSLNLVTPGQDHWDVVFEARDDHGLAQDAVLRITLAQGSGENIQVKARTVTLSGQGDAQHRRFGHRLDLATLGIAEGDDVIVQLAVRDNRSPQPQETRSTSSILRWPTRAAQEATGVEGLARRVLPAYFRSQRQIILDAEALQRQQRNMTRARFEQRSDAIGVDQRILRLRYGQFLGEEDTAQPDPPDHEHDGADTDLVEEFGHTHDIAEAATLLDPQTRAVLKQALDQMWQSELGLRQGQPERALPHAYKALDFIKRVQQADRIYLARVGANLAPVDENRRLGGKRDGLASRPDALRPSSVDNADLARLWEMLGHEPATTGRPDLAPLQEWLGRHAGLMSDPLALQAAISQVQEQPECQDCRSALRQLLWPLLARPPAAVPRRPPATAQGQRYLETLATEAPVGAAP